MMGRPPSYCMWQLYETFDVDWRAGRVILSWRAGDTSCGLQYERLGP